VRETTVQIAKVSQPLQELYAPLGILEHLNHALATFPDYERGYQCNLMCQRFHTGFPSLTSNLNYVSQIGRATLTSGSNASVLLPPHQINPIITLWGRRGLELPVGPKLIFD